MHGSVRAAALAVIATAVLAPSAAAAAASPADVTVQGTYSLVHVDGRVGHPGADGWRQELVVGDRAYDVKLRSGTGFRSGDTVRLSGSISGSTLREHASSITAFAPDVTTVSGSTNVLVVLADWTAPDSTTPAQVASVFAQDNAWFQQTSYGQLSLSTTVTGWVHVAPPAPNLCSDGSVATSLSTRAAQAAGYDPSAFDRVVVYFPSSSDPSCTNVAGFAEAPGSRVWLNGVMDLRSTVHEQGHNYGLYHAHSATCTAAGAPVAGPDTAADNCSYSDYGDPFDAMGASGYVGEYSASQKDVLGWLDDGRLAPLSSGGAVTLVPYEQQSSAVHAAVFQASATRSYWFENRAATGPDAALPVGATGGVLVHVDDTAVDNASGEASPWAPQQTYLLDASPLDRSNSAAVLGYGQSWTSPEGVTFTVGAPSGGGVVVRASTGGAPPVSGTHGSATGAVAAPTPGAAGSPVVEASFGHRHTTATLAQGQGVIVGGRVTVGGATAPGVTVQLQTSPHGKGAWRTVGTLTSNGSGAVSAVVRPTGSTDLRLAVPGTSAVSKRLTVVVRPVVRAAVNHPVVRHGRAVALDVVVPGHAGQLVTVQRLVHGRWHTYKTVRLAANGKRLVTVRPSAKGRYEFRFVKPADAFHLAAVSKPVRITAL